MLCLLAIRDFLNELIKMNRVLSGEKKRLDFDKAETWVKDTFSTPLKCIGPVYGTSPGEIPENVLENVETLVDQLLGGGNCDLAGFASEDDEKGVVTKKPLDKSMRYMSDMLHSEPLFMMWITKSKEDTIYYFTQRDMCQSCDDWSGNWVKSGGYAPRSAPKRLLILSAHASNRPLVPTADYTARLKKTEKKLEWEVSETIHPGRPRDDELKKKVIRIRVPELSNYPSNEYEKAEKILKEKTDSGEWKKKPGEIEIRMAKLNAKGEIEEDRKEMIEVYKTRAERDNKAMDNVKALYKGF
ncbi:MAG: hypothetical protein LBB21_01200 [Holosporaceae bacterium]|jgi:hypothetical protein|nr:hypothetical protein [Holosporaceae bacterium]